MIKISLADIYDASSLSSILGLQLEEYDYQLYINDNLICVFRKLINGRFKTDWCGITLLEWDQQQVYMSAYVIWNDNMHPIEDLIQFTPDLKRPTLWEKFADTTWRLVKGNGATQSNAAILSPSDWQSKLSSEDIQLYGKELIWTPFEGELKLTKNFEVQLFQSGVKAYTWTILATKPSWLLRSNMPVIKDRLEVYLYDENNNLIPKNSYQVSARKYNSGQPWTAVHPTSNIPAGVVEIKMVKDDIVACEKIFNISDYRVRYYDQTIDSAKISIEQASMFQTELEESALIDVESSKSLYLLKIKKGLSSIPLYLKGCLIEKNLKRLHFFIKSPFQGIALTNSHGEILERTKKISLTQLYGLRIISTPGLQTSIVLRNNLKPDVKIIKTVKSSVQPLIAYKDEIVRLFCLADPMDHTNSVRLEIGQANRSIIYQIAGFSHQLDIEKISDRALELIGNKSSLELFAIPLNCASDDILPIPLPSEESLYSIPDTILSGQFVVISSKHQEEQLMPRFINLDENYVPTNRTERII